MVVEIVPPSEREQQRRKRITAAVVEQQDVIRARRENDQLLSLQSELAEARRQNTELQQLSEEDQALHPSDKRTLLHLRYLNKCTHAWIAKITGNIYTVHIAACHRALYS